MSDVSWFDANKSALMAAVAGVREVLDRYAATGRGEVREDVQGDTLPRAVFSGPASAAGEACGPFALDALCAAFGLSSFERGILLLCAGMELDGGFAALCAAAQGGRPYPTFSLALAALAEPHWSALLPSAPLRRWRLIDVVNGELLTTSPLRIDEKVLHYLAGITAEPDERLASIADPVSLREVPAPSHRKLAEQAARSWSAGQDAGSLPAIQLCGDERADKQAVAAAIGATHGLNLWSLSAQVLPASPAELDALVRLWERESVLSSACPLLECDGPECSDPARMGAARYFAERFRGPVMMSTRERRPLSGRSMLAFDVGSPSAEEQRAVWRETLGAGAERLNGRVDALVSQFNMSVRNIRNACKAAGVDAGAADCAGSAAHDAGMRLWDACRVQTRPRLGELAQRVESRACWDDLVLPEPQKQTLREIAVHLRHRLMVYETWGFGSGSSRGLGISALFAGGTGTGKTLAAEVLARDLRLDLHRIDLSQVVNKYIGETEKNLRRVFDAAETGGAVLLFDEADALFGKRTEVKDSHDRYANIEVSYLLQRMEAYRGLAILTTNMKNVLDSAFLRRLRFIVHFPFPDAAQRAEIWRRVFPAAAPTEGLEVEKLARLTITGGNIRSIALNAAFLAADGGEPVGMRHVLRAARGEYAKLEKTMSEAEVRGWI